MKVDVQYLAKIIQMPVKPTEAKQLQAGFAKTIEIVKLLNQLDTTNISPNFQVSGLTNIFREDKIDKKRVLTQAQALANAKHTYQGYFVVSAILHET